MVDFGLGSWSRAIWHRLASGYGEGFECWVAGPDAGLEAANVVV
jgi:hypothetical protein